MTLERQYEKGWAKCSRCGCVYPVHELKDGICTNLERCERFRVGREKLLKAWDKKGKK